MKCERVYYNLFVALFVLLVGFLYQTLKFNGDHLPNPGYILISVCFYIFILGISAELKTAKSVMIWNYYNALS